ncbi:MAG TPA: energy transducer TonB [Candidatus Eisenbacteria bacterium]|nr:energy transducer TonB [Candidatus Eisenbacteria bacterium]
MKWVGKNLYFVGGRGWEGVGMMTPRGYWGVFQQRLDSDSSAEGTRGTHAGLVRPDGTIAIHGEYSDGKRGTFDVVWSPAPAPPAPPPPPATDPDRLPALGDYVYVEELPEALTKVKPVTNPTTPQGTVLVQALVGADGKVKDTRVVKSVPGLDDAAVAAVRQWVFKPAMTKGKPVAVWVAVPVRFER